MRRSALLVCCGEAGSKKEWVMPSPRQKSRKSSEENSPPLLECAAKGATSGGVGLGGEEPGGVEFEGAGSGGAEPGGAEPEGDEPAGVETRGAEVEGVETGGAESEGAESGDAEPWAARVGATRDTIDTGAGGVGVTTGAGGTRGAAAAGPGGARTRGTGAAGTGARAGGTIAGGAGAGGAGAVDSGAGGAGGEAASSTGARGNVRPRPYFIPLLQQPASPVHAPSPYSEHTGGLTERREPASRPASPVRAGRRVPCPRPPPVPGTHAMALRPSYVPLRVPLRAPLESSLPAVPDSESDLSRSANYATALAAQSEYASPPSIGDECALGTDVFEDRQEDYECLAAAVPRFASMLLAPEGDPDAPDIQNPRSYVEAITGPYSSQWQAAMDAEMASWKSTGTYVDAVPPSQANIVVGMWIFRVKRPPGSPPAFKACFVARGFS
ncbi:unnamed protein product [Closterium sp. NIES-54]